MERAVGRTHNLKLEKHRSFFLFSGFSVIADTTGTMIPSHLVPQNTTVDFTNITKILQNRIK